MVRAHIRTAYVGLLFICEIKPGASAQTCKASNEKRYTRLYGQTQNPEGPSFYRSIYRHNLHILYNTHALLLLHLKLSSCWIIICIMQMLPSFRLQTCCRRLHDLFGLVVSIVPYACAHIHEMHLHRGYLFSVFWH
jgi:hypothetical protein